MEITNVEIYGFRAALRGMRNPKNSWGRSDSTFWGSSSIIPDPSWNTSGLYVPPHKKEYFCPENPQIGAADLELACRLIRGGGPHRKFLRHIMVWADLNLPRYLWTEVDTYKVGTTRDSCSSMFTIGDRELEFDDFELEMPYASEGEAQEIVDDMQIVLDILNKYGDRYRDALHEKSGKKAAKKWIRVLKKFLAESFLQKATYSMSYETALAMITWRFAHDLPEWSGLNGLCLWIYSLPYMKEFVGAAGFYVEESTNKIVKEFTR